MNSYEERQAARKARYEQMAVGADATAERTYNKARTMAAAIPFGQPILVGHHSEGRDRRYRARIEQNFRNAFALHDRAKHYAAKAAAVGTGGISSDDPDALDKLREQLAAAERSQEMMRATNKAIRANKTHEARLAALLTVAGMTEALAIEALIPDYMGRIGFPAFSLRNNNASIARIRDRIAELEKRRQRATVEIQGDGYVYREDVEENRVMFIFDGKPDEATRTVLKRHAFKWSPRREAWVRQMTPNARAAAQMARQELDKKQ